MFVLPFDLMRFATDGGGGSMEVSRARHNGLLAESVCEGFRMFSKRGQTRRARLTGSRPGRKRSSGGSVFSWENSSSVFFLKFILRCLDTVGMYNTGSHPCLLVVTLL